MKKIASFLLILVALSSCTDEVRRYNPALQGLKDNVIWRGIAPSAYLEPTGVLNMTGVTADETLTLRTRFATPGTYLLGLGEFRKATFIDVDGITWATGTNVGDGEIVITEYDEVAGTVTGTFRFNAVKVDDNPDNDDEVLNFQEGVFYKVPIVPEL